ncbi:amidohydrolase family protein [Amycolatopsis sp.]|jgi:imidazolonepropionase-like amidohydrolase|uniref:amidohydrolase family protein n=1 Tax=Amycolatopsis sp. TaxID=37632 RepID=UPI002DFCA464|nr:amidohydrolase family protein [Amycolatopsis sp.]
MDTVITAAQVLPEPGSPLPDGAVLVRDDKIVAVGAREDVVRQAAPGFAQRDFPASTVMAGLFNSHVHLAFDAGKDLLGPLESSTPDELQAAARERTAKLLSTGVTTIRDLGDRDHLAISVREALDKEGVAAPRILSAAAPLTVPGGHCHFFGGAAADDDEIRALIDANAEAGADVIKVMASGGQITPGGADMWESQFDARQLGVIVEHARRHGLPVAAHAHGADAIESGVDAGVSTIEHCTWMAGPQQSDMREPVAKRMADQGIAACSTSSRNWRMMVERMGDEVAQRIYGRLTWLEGLGVPLIAGTDAGLPGSVFDDPVGALELYEWLGFSRTRILEIATADSARALGLGQVTGRLAPGYSADLLVVAGDPLKNLNALADVELVLAAGRAG